jgi:hypothetical protein
VIAVMIVVDAGSLFEHFPTWNEVNVRRDAALVMGVDAAKGQFEMGRERDDCAAHDGQ